jgi:hypothetical protein
MDEVKAELKQKELDLKEAKRLQKLNELEYKKKQAKLQKECYNIEHEKRKEKKMLDVEIER